MATLNSPKPVTSPDVVEALAKFDWGQDAKRLAPIDDAVDAARSDTDKKSLSTQLASVLTGDASRAAKDYACRQLSRIGSAESVSALASLLEKEELSDPARYALERLSCSEASAALRAAISKTSGTIKAGIITSLGRRRDAASAKAIVASLEDENVEVVSASISALGSIGSAVCAKALAKRISKAPKALAVVVADASLECASQLTAAGNDATAGALYKALSTDDQPAHVRAAAARGLEA